MQDTAGEVKTNSFDIFPWTPSYGRAKVGRPVRTYIQQFCADTGYRLEDLPGVIDNRDRWQEMISEICAGDISALNGSSLKLVNKFIYLGSCVSPTETDVDTRLTKAWTALDRLSVIWKSNLTGKRKLSFFQAAVVSILLYGCTTWTLTKRMEKKLDGNYTRMLRAILNTLIMVLIWTESMHH